MLGRLSVAAGLWLVLGGTAQALGLGDIKVASGLNQPFSASIPLTALTPEEVEGLKVKMAEPEDFARAGLERANYLSSVTVEAVTEGGNPRLVLSSTQTVREPLLVLLIEVKSGGPRILREYTVFLDPPKAGPAPEAPVVRAEAMPESEVAAPKPLQVPSRPPPGSEFFQTPEEAAKTQRPSTYGPIKSGESLTLAADRLLGPTGATNREQLMLALFEGNPAAFTDGHINALRRGSRLKVPSAEALAAIDPLQARRRVAELTKAAQDAVASLPTPAPEPEPAPAPAPTPEAPAAAPAPETAAATPGPAAPAADAAAPAPAGDGAAPAPAVATPAAPAAAVVKPKPPRPPVQEEPQQDLTAILVPALIVLVLIIIGLALWRSIRDRRANKEYQEAARSTGSLPSARIAAATAAAKSPVSVREELEEVERKLAEAEAEADAASSEPAPGDTREMQAAMDATTRMPVFPPSAAGTGGAPRDKNDFDVTSQFQANTLQIDLGENDPIAEADFHLAYGLYDEAALLLRQAADKAPERQDLRVKLAETLFAAGKAVDFQDVAEGLRGKVDAAAWDKLAIMGRQLCPDATVFRGEGGEPTAVDLSFDEPAADLPGSSLEVPSVNVDDGLDFKLEELELEAFSAPTTKAGSDNSLEFDLGEFDLDGTGVSSSPAPAAAAPAPAPAANKADNSLEFVDFDLATTEFKANRDAELDIKLDELDTAAEAEDPFSAADDVGTKLDLARAYVEMGDADTAKGLLAEVEADGSEEQKREAAKLRERLLG